MLAEGSLNQHIIMPGGSPVGVSCALPQFSIVHTRRRPYQACTLIPLAIGHLAKGHSTKLHLSLTPPCDRERVKHSLELAAVAGAPQAVASSGSDSMIKLWRSSPDAASPSSQLQEVAQLTLPMPSAEDVSQQRHPTGECLDASADCLHLRAGCSTGAVVTYGMVCPIARLRWPPPAHTPRVLCHLANRHCGETVALLHLLSMHACEVLMPGLTTMQSRACLCAKHRGGAAGGTLRDWCPVCD